MSVVAVCFYRGRRPGLGPAAEVLVLCFAKEKYPKERRPRCPCPPSPGGRWGQPAMLEAGVRLGTRCVLRTPLKHLRRGRSRSACVLRHTRHPSFRASRHGQKGGWERAPLVPLLRSACGPSLRSARQGGCTAPSAAHSATRPQAQLRSSSRSDPAPHPCWLRREAQGLGWVRVPQDTRTSSSGLPQLFERSLAKGQTQ